MRILIDTHTDDVCTDCRTKLETAAAERAARENARFKIKRTEPGHAPVPNAVDYLVRGTDGTLREVGPAVVRER
jgi:hypothetical protein